MPCEDGVTTAPWLRRVQRSPPSRPGAAVPDSPAALFANRNDAVAVPQNDTVTVSDMAAGIDSLSPAYILADRINDTSTAGSITLTAAPAAAFADAQDHVTVRKRARCARHPR